VAVAAFLAGKLKFTQISHLVEKTLSGALPAAPSSLGEVLAVDAEARANAAQLLEFA
jgi:1-deoxy-D-xylulose-5-phosphate reductoisomerase